VETAGQYPQLLQIEFVQDKCELLDKFSEGQDVTIGINLRGREYDKKDGSGKGYFNSIQGWNIKGASEQPSPSNEPAPSREKEE